MIRLSILAVFLCGLIPAASAPDHNTATPSESLEQARTLIQANRYTEALALLEPLVSDDLTTRTSWEIAGEAGRAAFHLGHYRKAHDIFRKVVQARPIVLEPAIYLQSTSYLMGDHRQAFTIFDAILKGGAQDLYLAVTLPGEQRFLNEPEVQAILTKYAQPLVVRPASATIQGVRLGQNRREIADGLGIENVGKKSTLVARAGPFPTWVFSFDENDLLREVVLNSKILDHYTPFTLELADGISWTSTPIACIGGLGSAHESSTTNDGALILTWNYPETSLDLVFSRPDDGRQKAAILEMVRMYLPERAENSKGLNEKR